MILQRDGDPSFANSIANIDDATNSGNFEVQIDGQSIKSIKNTADSAGSPESSAVMIHNRKSHPRRLEKSH